MDGVTVSTQRAVMDQVMDQVVDQVVDEKPMYYARQKDGLLDARDWGAIWVATFLAILFALTYIISWVRLSFFMEKQLPVPHPSTSGASSYTPILKLAGTLASIKEASEHRESRCAASRGGSGHPVPTAKNTGSDSVAVTYHTSAVIENESTQSRKVSWSSLSCRSEDIPAASAKVTSSLEEVSLPLLLPVTSNFAAPVPLDDAAPESVQILLHVALSSNSESSLANTALVHNTALDDDIAPPNSTSAPHDMVSEHDSASNSISEDDGESPHIIVLV